MWRRVPTRRQRRTGQRRPAKLFASETVGWVLRNGWNTSRLAGRLAPHERRLDVYSVADSGVVRLHIELPAPSSGGGGRSGASSDSRGRRNKGREVRARLGRSHRSCALWSRRERRLRRRPSTSPWNAMTARKLNSESFKTLFGTASRVEFRVKSSGSHFLQLHSLLSPPLTRAKNLQQCRASSQR